MCIFRLCTSIKPRPTSTTTIPYLRTGAAYKRGQYRTTTPHFLMHPTIHAWHFSPTGPAVSCSLSGTCYSSDGGAEIQNNRNDVRFQSDQ